MRPARSRGCPSASRRTSHRRQRYSPAVNLSATMQSIRSSSSRPAEKPATHRDEHEVFQALGRASRAMTRNAVAAFCCWKSARRRRRSSPVKPLRYFGGDVEKAKERQSLDVLIHLKRRRAELRVSLRDDAFVDAPPSSIAYRKAWSIADFGLLSNRRVLLRIEPKQLDRWHLPSRTSFSAPSARRTTQAPRLRFWLVGRQNQKPAAVLRTAQRDVVRRERHQRRLVQQADVHIPGSKLGPRRRRWSCARELRRWTSVYCRFGNSR